MREDEVARETDGRLDHQALPVAPHRAFQVAQVLRHVAFGDPHQAREVARRRRAIEQLLEQGLAHGDTAGVGVRHWPAGRRYSRFDFLRFDSEGGFFGTQRWSSTSFSRS